MNNTVRYATMKDSGIKWIGDVPETWSTQTLYQLATKVNNKNTDLTEQNLLSLSYGKIKRKDINSNDGLLPASFDGYNIIEAGDIVLRLTDLQNDHTSLRVGQATERGIITSAYITIRPNKFVHPRYLYYLIHAFDLKKGFYGMGFGVRQGLNYDEIKELRVALPSQTEQNIIATYLDDICTKTEVIISEIKNTIDVFFSWKKALIFEIVISGDTNQEFVSSPFIPWIEKYPISWGVLPIKRVILGRDGGAWGEESANNDNDRICMRVADFAFEQGRFKDVKSTTFTVRNYSNSQIEKLSLKKGDILVEKSGGGGKTPVGRSVLFDLPVNALFANFMDRLTLDTRIVSPEYFEFYWRAMYFKMVTSSYIKQTIGIQNLNLNELLASEYILIPKLNEQVKIVRKLDDLGSKIDSLISQKKLLISALESYKRSLIYETVTGKRKVV